MIIIQESDRSMIIPEGEKYLGASMDKDVVCKRFHIDRYTIDGDDKVNASVIRVLYCVNDKVYDGGIVTEMDYEEEGDYIEFPWVPSAACMQGPGTRGVSICIQWYSEDGETVTNDWNSGIGTFIVTESLHEPSDEEVEGSRVIVDSEVLTQLNNSLSGKADKSDTYTKAQVDALVASGSGSGSTGVSGMTQTQADARYSQLGHTHDEYASADHDHEGVYADVDHAHANYNTALSGINDIPVTNLTTGSADRLITSLAVKKYVDANKVSDEHINGLIDAKLTPLETIANEISEVIG